MTRFIVRVTATLLVIAVVCATLCALVNSVTAPRIAKNQAAANLAALKAVSGGHVPGLEITDPAAFREFLLNTVPGATVGTDISNDMPDERWGDAINSITPLFLENSNLKMKDGLAESGDIAGYSLNLTGSGYGGAFTLIASYLKDGELISAKMTQDSETAGLGKKAEEDWYMEMFSGKGSDSAPLPLSKSDLSEENAAAVSGASVTFGAVSRALKLGSDYVKEVSR